MQSRKKFDKFRFIGTLKGNIATKILFISYETDSKTMYVEVCIVKCLYLFYFGRYSHLNQRTVCHLGSIFNLINYVLWTSQEG